MEIVSVNNKGWIKEKFIETVLGTAEIQIADIIGANQDCKFIVSSQQQNLQKYFKNNVIFLFNFECRKACKNVRTVN